MADIMDGMGLLSDEETNKLLQEGSLSLASDDDLDQIQQTEEDSQDPQGHQTPIDPEQPQTKPQVPTPPKEKDPDESNTTTEDPDEDKPKDPESVSSGKNKETKVADPNDSVSPNPNSSIAEALKGIGYLQTLEDEEIKAIKTDEDLRKALEKDDHNRLDARQKRIDDALNYKVPVDQIKSLTDTINTLDSFTDKVLSADDEKGIQVRKVLIYRDFVNRGFSQEDAVEMVNRSFDSIHDKADAKKALASCKKFYSNVYDGLIEERKKKQEEQEKAVQAQSEKVKKTIMEDDPFLKELEVSQEVRQKIYDTVSKPSVIKGDAKLTPLQQFIEEHPEEFYSKVGMFYVLTNGFKDLKGLVKEPIKKGVNASLANLRNALNQSTIMKDPSLTLRNNRQVPDPSDINLDQWKLA